MAPTHDLPLPFLSAWDPRATSTGSIDPLGALRPFTQIATTILPGVTTITSRVRYLSWICAGLCLLDEVPDAPSGGRAGRARRKQILGWERLVALATVMHANAESLANDHPAWQQLRGVSYVRRAIAEQVCSPEFQMLRNQAGAGGVGTYWGTAVAGRLVEDSSGALTPRGTALAEEFLRGRVTPEREMLLEVLRGRPVAFCERVLTKWGRVTHLGAGSSRERQMLANALLEPEPHRRMASAMKEMGAKVSDGDAFRSIGEHLVRQQDQRSERLAAVLAVAAGFEALHGELLHRFDQVRWLGHRQPVPLSTIRLRDEATAPLGHWGHTLNLLLDEHGTSLPPVVAESLRGFSAAVEPIVRARRDDELVRALVSHHERVQAGKLDAARQPKLPWVELRGGDVVVAPRYGLEKAPEPPEPFEFTHPYRVEQFYGMLREAGEWEDAS